MYSLDRTQRIDAPADPVFEFFSDPGNLARITPPWLHFEIHGERPAPIAEGSRIEYRIRWTLFRLRWVTRIVRWQPKSEFQDVQEKGPYRTWVHTHTFTPVSGGVLMRDHVDYELPFGPVGRLAHLLVVGRQLRQIFDFRRQAIEKIFGKDSREAPRAAAT